MNLTELTLKIQKLMRDYKIPIDNISDSFGRLPSERIADFLLSNIESNKDRYISLADKMVMIDSIIQKGGIFIKVAIGEEKATIPPDCIQNNIRVALADSLYCNIHKELLCYIADAEMLDYMKQGEKLYTNIPLWEKAKQKVNDRITNARAFERALSQKQSNAVKFIYGLITEFAPSVHKTNAAAFIYDTLKAGGLIASGGDRDKQGKYQYLKNYFK